MVFFFSWQVYSQETRKRAVLLPPNSANLVILLILLNLADKATEFLTIYIFIKICHKRTNNGKNLILLGNAMRIKTELNAFRS